MLTDHWITAAAANRRNAKTCRGSFVNDGNYISHNKTPLVSQLMTLSTSKSLHASRCAFSITTSGKS